MSEVLSGEVISEPAIADLSDEEERRLLLVLTDKEKCFCWAYILHGENASQAGIALGYPKSAGKIGGDMLRKKHVQAYLQYVKARKDKNFLPTKIYGEVQSYQRKLDMLWRIAEKYEDGDARMSIAAIMEMNKMEGHYKTAPDDSSRLLPHQRAHLRQIMERNQLEIKEY